MYHQAPCDTNFFEWLDRLSDEEHHQVFLELRFAMKELGCRVDRYPLAAKDLLNLPPHVPAPSPLN